jgi:RNA polymerase sigma-70 factor (ECF subfamily)
MDEMANSTTLVEKLSISLKEEFSMLVKQNMKRAYFVALGFLGSHDEAMDASQTAFIKAYRNFHKFDRSRNFFTWYYKILKNTCLNIIRDKKNKGEVHFLELADKERNTYDISIPIEDEELKAKLEKALLSINEDDREIIILKEFEKYSYNEIAELLEIPVGTVMSKLFYARKKLYEKFKSLV